MTPTSLQDQADAIVAQQGGDPREDALLTTPVRVYGTPTSTPGANTTQGVLLDDGSMAFHKTFSGVNVLVAHAYGHHPDQVPINECAAWRLACALGSPLAELVAATVMWSHGGEAGALIAGLPGTNMTRDPFTHAPDQCLAAAFFDSLIAQQDRHIGNLRWDPGPGRLGLYDHGYSFARPGAMLNSTEFVQERWGRGEEDLRSWELDALDAMLLSGTLLGLRDILQPELADACRLQAGFCRRVTSERGLSHRRPLATILSQGVKVRYDPPDMNPGGEHLWLSLNFESTAPTLVTLSGPLS